MLGFSGYKAVACLDKAVACVTACLVEACLDEAVADLARLSQGILEGEELSAFISRGFKNLQS